MRLVTFRHPQFGPEAQAGVMQGDRLLSAAGLLGLAGPIEMIALLDRGPEGLRALEETAERFEAAHRAAAGVPIEVAVPVWEAVLLAPLPRPRSLRDFYAFEEHVATAHAKRGREVPRAWYEVPVFYFGHVGTIFGPDDDVPMPPQTAQLDFELEVACVIGAPGRNIPAEQALEHVAGFTILNDWSARDLQRQEMSVGLGPAKGKDFATSLGPWLVTTNEFRPCLRDGRLDLTMAARINGEEVTRGDAGTMHWRWADLIARASENVDLLPGDVLGSGTVGGGCLLELGEEVHPWLEPGDVVELEVERLGRLRNRVGATDVE